MTGKNVYDMLQQEIKKYISSKEDNLPPPIIELTPHQIYKMLDYCGVVLSAYNCLSCLAAGKMKEVRFCCLILKLKEAK